MTEPTSPQAVAVYRDIVELRKELRASGVEIVPTSSRGMTGLEEGIVIAIAGGVGTHVVTSFIDFLMERLRSRRAYDTSITIVHDGHVFEIPARARECKRHFQDRDDDDD